MTVLLENPHDGNFILSEDDEGRLSRDNIVIASGAGALLPGTVLGKLTASSKFAPSPETAADGSEAAVAILVGRVDATSSDVAAVGLMRHHQILAAGYADLDPHHRRDGVVAIGRALIDAYAASDA